MAWYDRFRLATKADLNKLEQRLEKTMADEDQDLLDQIAEVRANNAAAVTELAGQINTQHDLVLNLKAQIDAGLHPSPAVKAAMADLLTASRAAKQSADAQVAALNPPAADPGTGTTDPAAPDATSTDPVPAGT
jgi:peptidoglycan hydrolase CwlO-like protein